MNNFISFALNVLEKIGLEKLFLLAFIVVGVAFVLVITLSIFKRGYALKKRLWYGFFTMGITLLLYSAVEFVGSSKAGVYAFASACALSFAPLLFIRVRKIKFKKSYRNFVRYIDGQINNSEIGIKSPREQEEVLKTSSIEREEYSDLSRFELDFKHVKKVMDRLEYYGLSNADKKLVRDLQDAICDAENGDYRAEVKNRINEGLGALLKIMSKYGI